jgi:hypothetical protein
MTRDAASTLTSSKTLARVLIAAGAVGLFFTAASVVDPGASSALPSIGGEPPPTAEVSRPLDKSLGRYQGVDHAVLITATPEGPRYTITDAAGNVLETDLLEYEVYSALEAHGIEIGSPVDNSPALMIAEDRFEGVLD